MVCFLLCFFVRGVDGYNKGDGVGAVPFVSPLYIYMYACRFASMLSCGGFKPDTPELTIVKGASIV